MAKKLYIAYGCQMNVYDSEHWPRRWAEKVMSRLHLVTQI